MSKISRRKFIASSAAAVGAGIIGTSKLPSTLISPSQALANTQNNDKAENIANEAAPSPSQNYYNDSKFLHWSFGNIENSSPFSAKSSDFKYWFDPVLENKKYSFREEVFNACKLLDEKRAGKTIALCLSGGMDSEIIALALDELKIPFELYFLDFFGFNLKNYTDLVRPFGKKLNKEINIVSINKDYFVNYYSRETFLEYGCENPTGIAMTYLFKSIPDNQFIVSGHGDLDRQGELYLKIGSSNPAPSKDWYLPFSTLNVLYYLWAEKNNRPGSYYFYSSTPELIASVINDPRFGLDYPYGFTRSVIKHAFPEVKSRKKNMNWVGNDGHNLNHLIRKNARLFCEPAGSENRINAQQYLFWNHSIGTPVRLKDIFIEKKENA